MEHGHSHDHDGHSHSHGHSHGLGHSHTRNASFSTLSRILILSGVFMIAEIVGGLWSGSLALLADAGHMAIDTAAVGLGLFALWVSRKPPTQQRTYGYLRAEILAAAVNGALLVAASIWILVEAYGRFSEPHSIDGPWMTIIAFGGLLVNLIGIQWMRKTSDTSLNSRAVTLHLISDALGSVGAIVAGILIWQWNLLWADSVMSVIIALLILRGAFRLLLECVDILLESVPSHINVEVLRADLLKIKGVTEVHDLHVWAIASGVTALSAHVRVTEGHEHGTVLHLSLEMLETSHGIQHATLQLEPEAYTHEDTLDCQKTN